MLVKKLLLSLPFIIHLTCFKYFFFFEVADMESYIKHVMSVDVKWV
jgi:hypothetical protein